MDQPQLTLETIQKLHDLTAEGCFFSKKLLKENNLLSEAIINYIFESDDFLDSVTITEAIGAMPSEERKFKYNRKNALMKRSPLMSKIRRGRYEPKELLNNVLQYIIILKHRDQYMPIKMLADKNKIKPSIIYKRMYNNNIPRLYRIFIKTEDIEKIIYETKPTTPTQNVTRRLGVSYWTLWRYAKKAGLRPKCGAITKNEEDEIRPYIKIPNNEVRKSLNIEKEQFAKITKELGIKTYGGYIGAPEIKKIKECLVSQKTCTNSC